MSFYGHINNLVETSYRERERSEDKLSEQWVMDDVELLVVLRLMKKSYEERGVPYHFCREDHKRNKAGQKMNEFCDVLCVGPGKNGNYAMVTCCSNQRLQDTPIWGTQSHFHNIPTAEERALLLNEAFGHVEAYDKEKSSLGKTKNLCGNTSLPKLPKHWIDLHARPRIDIGELVSCRYMGRWIAGKVVAHFPEESYKSESTLRIPAPYLGTHTLTLSHMHAYYTKHSLSYARYLPTMQSLSTHSENESSSSSSRSFHLCLEGH